MKNLLEHPASLLILVLVIVVLLGWKRLPDMARSLGRSSRILKSEIDEMKTESKSKASTETVQGQTTTPVHDANGNPIQSGETVMPATRADARRTDV